MYIAHAMLIFPSGAKIDIYRRTMAEVEEEVRKTKGWIASSIGLINSKYINGDPVARINGEGS